MTILTVQRFARGTELLHECSPPALELFSCDCCLAAKYPLGSFRQRESLFLLIAQGN